MIPTREPPSPSSARVDESLREARREIDRAAEYLRRLVAALDPLRRAAEELSASTQNELAQRARLARIGAARLQTDVVTLTGRASDRLRVRRHVVGEALVHPFTPSVGITEAVTDAPDVRSMWDRLLARERALADGGLRGLPSTVLDIPPSTVRLTADGVLDVALARAPAAAGAVVAVPRFAHALATRKVTNFAHWLFDCLPQVVVLRRVAPDASVLVPALRPVQRATLALAGVAPDQAIEWDGATLAAARVVVFESDGRRGGGRPLSALACLRSQVLASSTQTGPARRRFYVSRRDARRKRQWAANEAEIERLFATRGFEIVCPTDHRLPDLTEMFGGASIIAGVNGAGLAHMLFAPPGAHVIALLTDSLLRWHAHEGVSRALWLSDADGRAGELAELSDSPRFFAHAAAAFGQRCHAFLSGDDVPIDRLTPFVDRVLDEAGRGRRA